jgi:CHAD domain-containing protein
MVHRARVASRRVQNDLAALFPKPYPKKVRNFRRVLKKVRRDLGGWRNCDVVLALLEEKIKPIDSKTQRSAWKIPERYVKDERRREIDDARSRLAARDVDGLSARLKKLLDREPDGIDLFGAALEDARDQWRTALAAAAKSRADADLHAFRIATKKLRYRLELGGENLSLVDDLKRLQRALGSWRDRELCDAMTAAALARPKILLREFDAARALLSELEKDQLQRARMAEEILRAAAEVADKMGIQEGGH